MKRTTNNNELIGLEGIQQEEISLEEQERIMNSRWFINWMDEYHSNDVLFEER